MTHKHRNIYTIIVIKTAGNIRIYSPRVFRVRSGPNQSYSIEYGW